MSGIDRQKVADAYRYERDRLLRFLQRYTRDLATAEDILSDTMEEFIEATDVGSILDDGIRWLFTVARHKVIDLFRRRARRRTELIDDDSLISGDDVDPFERIVADEFLQALSEALEALPRDQREVFIAHELDGKSFLEISKATGVGVNTLLSRKRYAVLRLRKALAEYSPDNR